MDRLKLKDGRVAEVSFLSQKDGVRELSSFINSLIEEDAFILMDRKVTLREEEEWKKAEIAKLRKKEGYVLVARVDGRIAGTSGATRERGKGSGNVLLGIAVAKGYRGLHLGEGLLRLNMKTAERMFKPRNIYLSVFGPNRIARNLYEKLGFRGFAVFPKWLRHKGRYVDHVMMRL